MRGTVYQVVKGGLILTCGLLSVLVFAAMIVQWPTYYDYKAGQQFWLFLLTTAKMAAMGITGYASWKDDFRFLAIGFLLLCSTLFISLFRDLELGLYIAVLIFHIFSCFAAAYQAYVIRNDDDYNTLPR